jgi:hypothetical protein
MGITLELATHDEDTLAHLDDDTTEAQIASALFEESEHTYTAGRIWHVIHYLLTESVDSVKTDASFLLWGGTHVGPRQRHGLGRARVLSPKKCKKVAAALIDEKTFTHRLSEWKIPSDVVYADHIKRGAPEADHVKIYTGLADFVRGAAERGQGILLSIVA